uniref:Plexin-B1 n=1 Tax=Knipowitschia caucasica TaxID=637954 RepID=A0AAV2M6E5_KNICA
MGAHCGAGPPVLTLLVLSVALSISVTTGSDPSQSYPTFTHPNTVFEHFALHPDPHVGRVYVGARNHLFQLNKNFQIDVQADTGPVTDSQECLPPVTEITCPQARSTNNHNKLLLVDPYSENLITCGSVNQGICQKRSLDSVDQIFFSTERPVDTQYVAANHPNVSTVGVVVRAYPERQPVLFVGRGYTSSHPPISTRNLAQGSIFSYEDTAKLAVAGRLSEYDHHFVATFAHQHHVYFLFYRRDLKSQSREYRTYVSRVCLDDQSYYSYVEVPLTCRSRAGKVYSLLQAVQLGRSGVGGLDVLLGVFSTQSTSSPRPSEDSALCMFNLHDIDVRINSTRDLCYTQMGREAGVEAAYIEYEVKSICANLPTNTLEAYPCGSDHTPSPMASKIPVEAETILDSPSARLTAVAVSVRAGHVITFLGDSKGNLHKVFLGPNGEVEEYSVISIQQNTAISADLILDQAEQHLFIMTQDMLQKRPVAECWRHEDCHSCVLAHDPYCGWCILQGRCMLQSECARGQKPGQWLWSFDMEQQCLSIQELSPANVSKDESHTISLFVPGLPVLEHGESYTCFFQNSESPAAVSSTGVSCRSPHPSRVPAVAPGQDFVKVVLSLRFGNVTVTERDFSIFDCEAVKQLSGSMPCRGCVLSRWGCNWCVHQHMCTHKPACEDGVIIYNQHFKLPTSPPPTSKALEIITTDVTPTTATTKKAISEQTLVTIHDVTAPPTLDSNGVFLPTAFFVAETTEDVAPLEFQTSVLPPPPPPLPTEIPEVPETPKEQDEPGDQIKQLENDNATFSAGTVLSGDGEMENTPPPPSPLLQDSVSEPDYQYDPDEGYLPGDEGSYVSWGASACPCVEKIQGSSLLPVRVKRKITLLAHNLHLYQDSELDYQCVLVIEGQTVVVDAYVEMDDINPSNFDITCQLHEYEYSAQLEEYNAMVYVKRRDTFHVDSTADIYVTLYNCSVGRLDCSRCHTADQKYGCVWCGGAQASCVYSDTCSQHGVKTCPAPVIHSIEPLSGLLEGGTMVTITGSNLGQKPEDILHSVLVAGVPCTVIPSLYEVSSRIVCKTRASGGETTGHVSVTVSGGEFGRSIQIFSYQDPFVMGVSPVRGPKAGGTILNITGLNLLTGRPADLTITIGKVLCDIVSEVHMSSLLCETGPSKEIGEHRLSLHYGHSLRHLHSTNYLYTPNPNITHSSPANSFMGGGRLIYVYGYNLDVVQWPRMVVTISLLEPPILSTKAKSRRRRSGRKGTSEPDFKQFVGPCEVNSSSLILCHSPVVDSPVQGAEVRVEFHLDNLSFDFSTLNNQPFRYEPNPILQPLNQQDRLKVYRYNPGSFIQLEGENLDLAMTKDEVLVEMGDGVCAVKTLTKNHLYCEPPPQQPAPAANGNKREGSDSLPEFIVRMGNLNFSLGKVQYDNPSLATFPLEAQIGVGVGASIVALIVLIIVLIYRRKSKQALRDYKKVQIQLENLETSVRDRCKKEFTDLMTEMMDMSSDLVGSGIPFLDYRRYAERIFFPGHRESPLRRDLDVQECRRQTVEQGLVQLSNLLNSKLFLTKFIHTLESQRTFSPRDRAYVASLLTVSLHGKLEYFTDILKTLLNDLVDQYVAKNPKLMLRRTETVVEKLLTNWMSICLYTFLRDSAGEPLYMLFRAIKHQVDKGPVDAVTGKAKYTLNDNRLLREDVEYKTLTLNVEVQGSGLTDSQPLTSKVLDCDTITQVKEKILDQVFKGTSFSHRPHADSLDLEWRSGVAGHLILSDEDLTSVVQGNWKRLNTLQHYKVPDGATVALIPRHTKHIHHDNHEYVAGEKTPMLEDADEGGVRLWHLVKASEEPELPKHRRGSMRERERAKAIPEIYLTRLLSMKGTLQKFVDDLFMVILSTSRPVPLAVKYFFDLLDDQAGQHGITDPETIHIWKTNSLPLRFWINIVKNPQFIFDVQASDHVDAVLSVIAQTFMDSCTIAEHKLGRDSPINKLLYARDIPRYKQMVERYYADIRQTISASDQEMNSALAELSRNYSGELNYLVALHELYKYINKYYDQIITALEEDPTAQKMQLGYRLQQIAAAVENKGREREPGEEGDGRFCKRIYWTDLMDDLYFARILNLTLRQCVDTLRSLFVIQTEAATFNGRHTGDSEALFWNVSLGPNAGGPWRAAQWHPPLACSVAVAGTL